MSKRNKIIWGITGVLTVLAVILATVLIFKSEKESIETQSQTSVEPQQKKQENVKKNQTKTEEIKKASLIFTGDVLLSDYVLNNYNHAGVEGILDEAMLQALKDSDVAIINQEFPFSTRGQQAPDKQFTFRVNPSYVGIFTQMGVDMVTLANNHVLDYGEDALLDTMDTLEQADIMYAGAGDSMERASQLQIKEVNGLRIGMLAASRVIPVTSWNIENHQPGVFCTYDPALLLREIEKAREACDYLVVYVHWGIERNTNPEEYQKIMARQYIDAGADAVIGSHPHVLQGIEFYENKPIFYSLGNFIFNQTIEKTMAVCLEVETEKNVNIRILPATASEAKTTLLEGENAQQLYRYLENISEEISIDQDGIVSKKVEP